MTAFKNLPPWQDFQKGWRASSGFGGKRQKNPGHVHQCSKRLPLGRIPGLLEGAVDVQTEGGRVRPRAKLLFAQDYWCFTSLCAASWLLACAFLACRVPACLSFVSVSVCLLFFPICSCACVFLPAGLLVR